MYMYLNSLRNTDFQVLLCSLPSQPGALHIH